jgi:peroxiredoxin Q/BCP
MKSSVCSRRRGVAGLLALAIALMTGASAAELSVGDPAPAFSLPGSDGESQSLARYRGKQNVVVAWFPKAFTPG